MYSTHNQRKEVVKKDVYDELVEVVNIINTSKHVSKTDDDA